jgi:hypothetical protein
MKLPICLSLIITVIFVCSTFPAHAKDRCDIEQVFEIDDKMPSVIILTADGEVEELSDIADAVLVPTRLQKGVYEVEVTWTSRDVYVAKKEGLVIKTRYCHRHARSENAIVKYVSNHSWTKGELIFGSGR